MAVRPLEATPGPGVPGGTADDLAEFVAAVRDPTRRSILLGFQADPAPRTVDEVAAAAGVHRTVAFMHLEQLAGLGFLDVGRRRGRLGKPAKLYRLGGRALRFERPARQFVLLSSMLAAAAVHRGGPAPEALRIARARGAELHDAGDGTGMAAAVAVLERLGGSPRVDGAVLHAGNCVFREACGSAAAVVCGVQAALLEGAMAAAGTPGRVEPLGADDGGGCLYRVADTG